MIAGKSLGLSSNVGKSSIKFLSYLSLKTSGHLKFSCQWLILNQHHTRQHSLTCLLSTDIFTILTLTLSLFCVKLALNLNLFSVCLYDSLPIINWIIKAPSASSLFLVSISFLLNEWIIFSINWESLIQSENFCYNLFLSVSWFYCSSFSVLVHVFIL